MNMNEKLTKLCCILLTLVCTRIITNPLSVATMYYTTQKCNGLLHIMKGRFSAKAVKFNCLKKCNKAVIFQRAASACSLLHKFL